MITFALDGIKKKQEAMTAGIANVQESAELYNAEDVVNDVYQRETMYDTVGDYLEAAELLSAMDSVTESAGQNGFLDRKSGNLSDQKTRSKPVADARKRERESGDAANKSEDETIKAMRAYSNAFHAARRAEKRKLFITKKGREKRLDHEKEMLKKLEVQEDKNRKAWDAHKKAMNRAWELQNKVGENAKKSREAVETLRDKSNSLTDKSKELHNKINARAMKEGADDIGDWADVFLSDMTPPPEDEYMSEASAADTIKLAIKKLVNFIKDLIEELKAFVGRQIERAMTIFTMAKMKSLFKKAEEYKFTHPTETVVIKDPTEALKYYRKLEEIERQETRDLLRMYRDDRVSNVECNRILDKYWDKEEKLDEKFDKKDIPEKEVTIETAIKIAKEMEPLTKKIQDAAKRRQERLETMRRELEKVSSKYRTSHPYYNDPLDINKQSAIVKHVNRTDKLFKSFIVVWCAIAITIVGTIAGVIGCVVAA